MPQKGRKRYKYLKVKVKKGQAMKNSQNQQGLCEICGINPKAVNYKKDGKTYYRSKCNSCLKNKIETAFTCVMCGFNAKYKEQLVPVSADKANQSVCLNCDIVRNKERAKLDRFKPVADN